MALSPDGKTIVTGSYDKTARGCGMPPPAGHSAHPWSIRASVMSVAFSPDGKTVLTGSDDKTARLWDAATGQPVGRPLEHSDSVLVRGVQPRRQDDPHRVL